MHDHYHIQEIYIFVLHVADSRQGTVLQLGCLGKGLTIPDLKEPT
jgi:hypothetical protein